VTAIFLVCVALFVVGWGILLSVIVRMVRETPHADQPPWRIILTLAAIAMALVWWWR